MQEEDMTQSESLEYASALDLYRHYTNLRRYDMAFVTTAQGAVLTIIGKDLMTMNLPCVLLSLIAFFLLLLGLNSERRLTAYMSAYIRRAKEIESKRKMVLLSSAYSDVSQRRFLVSNTLTFPLYYGIFALSWLLIWTANIF